MDAKYVEENLKRISEYTFTDTNLFWDMEAGEHQNDIEFLLEVIDEYKRREDLWKRLADANENFIKEIYEFFGNKLVQIGTDLRDECKRIRDEANEL